MRDELSSMRSQMNDVLEVLKIAKSSDGKVGKDRTMLDEKRRVTFGYVDNDNQIVEVKIPVDGVEVNAVAATERLDSAYPAHEDTMANNFIRQVSKDVAKQANKVNKTNKPN
jgi:hypothetical protein